MQAGSGMSAVCGLLTLILTATAAPGGEPGTVILHGGGSIHSELRDRFVQLGGGPNARVIVIPTADPDSPLDESRLDYWRRRNVASVGFLHTTNRTAAESERFAEPLKQATAVWISGGYQSRLANIYRGTPVERELAAVLDRGGVIAGTSAGAAIMSPVMIVRNDVENGFDILPACVIDQHFLARQRQQRLWNVLASHPQKLGLGIDENTAAIICGDQLSVFGDSTVSVCMARFGMQPQKLDELKSGEQIDLKPLLATLQSRK